MWKREIFFFDMGRELWNQVSFIYLTFTEWATLWQAWCQILQMEKYIYQWHLSSRACKDLLKRSRHTNSIVLTLVTEVLEDVLGTQPKNHSVRKGENSYHYPSCVLVAGLVIKLTANQNKRRKNTNQFNTYTQEITDNT